MTKDKLIASVVCVLLFLFSLSAVVSLQLFGSWHDQQRALQLLFLIFSALIFFVVKIDRLCKISSAILTLVFFLGFVSSFCSEYFYWSTLEYLRYVLIIVLFFVVRGAGKEPLLQYFVFWLVAVIAFILASKSILNYIFDLLIGVDRIDIRSIYYGFDNLRFFGQFQVFCIPVIGFLYAVTRSSELKNANFIAIMLFFALMVQWAFVFALGSRGVWLALGLTMFFVFIAIKAYRAIIKLQMIAILTGFFLYFLMFNLIPDYIGSDVRVYDSLRQTSSGRVDLWYETIQVALENLYLGVGPMHFASIHSSIAAHPHQMILQFFVEWGLFTAILILVLMVWGLLYSTYYVLKNKSTDHYDVTLFIAIVAALILAQVDGVFVMPYVEVWLAVFVGLAFSRWESSEKTVISFRFKAILFPLVLFGSAFFMYALYDRFYEGDKGFYISQSYENILDYKKPRFWRQGYIPMTPIE